MSYYNGKYDRSIKAG